MNILKLLVAAIFSIATSAGNANPSPENNNFKLKFEDAELKKIVRTVEGPIKGRLCIYLVGKIKNVSSIPIWIDVLGDEKSLTRGSIDYLWKDEVTNQWETMWLAGTFLGGEEMKLMPGEALQLNRMISVADDPKIGEEGKREPSFKKNGIVFKIFGKLKPKEERVLLLESTIKLK